jgi:hypothetical protein
MDQGLALLILASAFALPEDLTPGLTFGLPWALDLLLARP